MLYNSEFQAYKVAEEGNVILLMIFLNSNDGDSLQFEKSTLKNENFTAQIRDVTFKTPAIILSEISNHYHFTCKRVKFYQYYKMFIIASKSLGITKFPAVAIKAKLQDKFQTVLCYEGFLDVTMLMSLVQSVLLACESEIAQAAEISAMRALQSEQDAAYMKSFEIDKEKLRNRKKLESESSESQVDNLTTNYMAFTEVKNNITMESLDERISKALLDLEDEPEDVAFKFQFLFPDGTRKIRKFSLESTTKVHKNVSVCLLYQYFFYQSLFDFVFAVGVPLKNENIAIRSIEPAVEFLEEAEPRKLKEIDGIGKGMKLFIEYI